MNTFHYFTLVCALAGAALFSITGCSSDGSSSGSTADAVSSADSVTSGGGTSDTTTDGGTDGTTTEGSTTEGGTTDGGSDGGTGDTGVDTGRVGGPPAPAAYSAGTCPALGAGGQTFLSGTDDRQITVTLPSNPDGAGIMFLWHGFGDTDGNFSSAVGASSIANAHNVIVIAPAASLDPLESDKLKPYKDLAASFIGPLPPTWSILDGPEMDLTLFDDLLSCADEQYAVDPNRIYSMGFSQGALWTAVLIMNRSEQIAAALSWSGGLGTAGGIVEVVNMAYETPGRRIPVLAAAGGEVNDLWPNAQLALVNFQTGTNTLAEGLLGDGHVVVQCDHGLGHTIPSDGLGWGLTFLFDHEWTEDGDSDYWGFDGTGFPDYCSFPTAP